MTLVVPEAIRSTLFAHARAGAPAEVVGVLAGSRGDERSSVERAYRAENTASTPRTRYEIDPREEIGLLERIDDAGLDPVGFYHSHPEGPPGPSETDARLAAWSGYSYVIVSFADGTADLGSWRWDGERFSGEAVRSP